MSVFSTEIEVVNTPLPVDGSGFTQPVSGTVTANAGTGPFPVSDNGGSLTVDGPLTDTELRATPVPITGTVSVGSPTTLATVTNISVGTSPTTLSASNSSKTKVIIYNETGTLFVKLGTGASSTSYSIRLTANSSWEFTGYAGVVSGTKATGTTAVLVTEVGI